MAAALTNQNEIIDNAVNTTVGKEAEYSSSFTTSSPTSDAILPSFNNDHLDDGNNATNK